MESVFLQIEALTQKDKLNFLTINTSNDNTENFKQHKLFLDRIIKEIDELASELQKNDWSLISIKHQQLLKTCFQLITLLGISPSLIPGLGINISKRCSSASLLNPIRWTDDNKYEMLCVCTDFFTRSYCISELKKIIVGYHLSDYLASLIQLSFAPLKKPGTYANFVMTQELYEKLNNERKKYVETFENLVQSCFQPFIIKELLVLQSVTDPQPPMFARKVISKELSQRLLINGGLLSLIRCLEPSFELDTGLEWKGIDTISNIISTKHGKGSDSEYLCNICQQLKEILLLRDTNYLTTATACLLRLNEKYPENNCVKELVADNLYSLDYKALLSKCSLPGTILLSPSEVEQKLRILHTCVTLSNLSCPQSIFISNLYSLLQLGLKCTKNELSTMIKYVILKSVENLTKVEVLSIMKEFLFNESHMKDPESVHSIIIEEYDAGLAIKCVPISQLMEIKSDSLTYFVDIFNSSTSIEFVENVFDSALQLFNNISISRHKKTNRNVPLESLSTETDNIFNKSDQDYMTILKMLMEISSSPKVLMLVKNKPELVLNLIEFILHDHINLSEECVTVALVLLSTVLSNVENHRHFSKTLNKMLPILRYLSKIEGSFNKILSEEILTLIETGKPSSSESEYSKAVTEIFDTLLPVKAHGIMTLTKLIEQKDPETISKKHYIFCLLEEQLKNSDSYVYLAAINGLSALGTYCTEDVLHVMCKEFLEASIEKNGLQTKDEEDKICEIRMKVGDVIVKITKNLGEMAIPHKSLLLNTVLCGCRDEEPLIRASALSNLAELARVLHYRIGIILYEVLLCVWSTVESDMAVECRRAAVMVISSLLKGLAKETLIQLKDNLLPIYRSLKKIYSDTNEDPIVKLHAQIALEELNDIVNDFLFPKISIAKQISILNVPEDPYK